MTPMGRSGTLDQARLRIPFDLASVLTFAALAALILNPLFGARAALVFLFFGLLLIASQPEYSFNALAKYKALLILPAFCAISSFWSEFPALTLRYSLQLTITFAIAIVIATRVAPAALLRCLYACYGIGILGSVLFGRIRDDNGAWVGIFGSKNAFASVVTGFALTALALAIDRTVPRPLRLLAIGSALISVPLLLLAQSTGSIVFIIPAAVAILAMALARYVSKPQKLVAAMVLACGGVIALIVVLAFGEQILDSFLELSGKDVTLTGRTDLWEVAFKLIAERPLLGQGYQAFWVQDYGPAEDLWAMFDIKSRSGFNFHNTYISNAVEIGIVGVAMQIAVICGTYIGILRWALGAPSAESAYMVGFLTLLIGTSFIEVGVYFQFSLATIVLICASVYAMRYQEWRRAQSATDEALPPYRGYEMR